MNVRPYLNIHNKVRRGQRPRSISGARRGQRPRSEPGPRGPRRKAQAARNRNFRREAEARGKAADKPPARHVRDRTTDKAAP